ncbi:hypothetical protein KMW28_28385 [Flammeovirga yaeyamensis]|uniref:Uncharacterized protein n=1 Tax=Flammeovirga yaeyamensis TaxID=367791 RepID=A0AAX1NES8_9BACT|nr:hypothetical protein [Flammeovirga yaeyamensis]MBB3697265.1 hypothetical protein [Flammeovirga yaeyamensis]NMF33922.1 hypothetical protein [Flammeovirga yaeyamensis]QWG04818.1 hypothetical protein KMW28_28385 [Flammeovirga yaeyamensis]
MKDIITQSGSISLELTDELTDDVVDMLEETLWGTEGGLRYVHTETRENLERTPKAYFLNLRRNNSLLSTITLIHKSTKLKGNPLETYHIRYFAFLPSMQSKKQNANKKKKKNSFLDQQLINFFNDYRMPESAENNTPQCFHAQVENDNLRSKMFTEKVGFETVGRMTTLTFSRITPKKSEHLVKLSANEKSLITQRADDFYKDYAFYSNETIGLTDDSYVLNEDGEVIVGGQVYIGNWKFKHLPGVEGMIAKYMLPYIPYANRLFNFKHHTFVTVEGLFWKKGYEHKVQDFLSSVLKEKDKNVAFIWMDPDSEDYKTVKDKVDWGVLEHLNSGSKTSVILRTEEALPSDYEAYRPMDKYISGFYIL